MRENKHKEFVVYRIYHIDTGKSYIGITGNYERRMKDHFNSKDNYYLHNAIRKHGKEKFITEIIFECDSWEDVKKEEREYISVFDTKIPNGYNETDGGEGTFGYKFSKEACLKMSEDRKGRTASEETKQKLSIAHSGENNGFYGKEHSEKTKKFIGQKSKERKHSEEWSIHMRELMSGREVTWGDKLSKANSKLSEEQVLKIIKMLDNNVSQYKIADKFNVHQGTICNIKRGKTYRHLSKLIMTKLIKLPKISKIKKIFSTKQILEIRKMLLNKISHRIIAKKFDVHYSTISRIKRNKTYADIQLPKEA